MSKVELSTTDRKILNCIQEDLPLTPQPFRAISKKVGLEESQLLKRIRELKDKGIIRNLRGRINHRKLKFKSTLIAFKIPKDKIEPFAKKISSRPEVTHCYLRKGEYNLWTVFIYKNGGLKKMLNGLTRDIGEDNILNLPTKRQFKLKTSLKI